MGPPPAGAVESLRRFLSGVMEAAAAVAGGEVTTEDADRAGGTATGGSAGHWTPVSSARAISRGLPGCVRMAACSGTVGSSMWIGSGLPTDSQIQLLAQSAGVAKGEFLLTASAHVAGQP